MGLGRRGTSRGSTSETTNIPEHGARRPAIITSTACLRSDLREAGIVPRLEPWPCLRNPTRCVPCDPAPHDSRSTPPLGDRGWRRTTTQPMQSSRHGVLVQRDLEGPRLTAVSGGRAPQPALWARPCKSQPSQPGRPSWCVSKIGAVRPRTDHRSIQGSGGPVGHAPRRRGAGPARADWVGGGWRWTVRSSRCGRISGDRLVPLNSQYEQCLDCPHGPLNALECRSALFEPARGQG